MGKSCRCGPDSRALETPGRPAAPDRSRRSGRNRSSAGRAFDRLRGIFKGPRFVSAGRGIEPTRPENLPEAGNVPDRAPGPVHSAGPDPATARETVAASGSRPNGPCRRPLPGGRLVRFVGAGHPATGDGTGADFHGTRRE